MGVFTKLLNWCSSRLMVRVILLLVLSMRSKGLVKLPANVSIPAVIGFGDSIIDPGNNNKVKTLVKCNFPPYGKDFQGGPTGRFCNGKIPSDLLVEELGIKNLLPAYLDPNLKPDDLVTGVCFASGASGYDPLTPKIASVISMSEQIEMFKEYIGKLKQIVGVDRTNFILANSFFLVVAGSDDIANTYFVARARQLQYDIPAYTDLMCNSASDFVKELYGLGARRIGVLGAPPIGCVPSQRTLAGGLERECAEEYNYAAKLFNSKLSISIEEVLPSLWLCPNQKKMWHSTTLRALRLSSFLFSSSSSFSSSSLTTISSPSPFATLTTIITQHSFTPTSRVSFTVSRHFSTPAPRCVSSLPTLDWNDAVSCSEVNAGSRDDGTVDQDTKPCIPVRAFFFSTSVDLKSLVEQNKPNVVPPSSRMTNYIVLKFGDICDSKGLGSFLSGSNGCYMVVFQYGSIVLFNVAEHEVDDYLKIVKKHASGLLPEMRKDEYEVREKPSLSTWMEGGLDYIMLQYLNVDGIRTIGSVLGQSIALDYYGRQVDGMVAEFTDINREMEATGKFKMQRKKLFQLVGKANSNLADVILKLGLFERSDIAWKDAKYAQIWEYLRDEFELTQRFASLDFKLKFVEHNIRFLQEILQNRKSDFLEWLIIALIGAEILLSLYDIVQRSGMKL